MTLIGQALLDDLDARQQPALNRRGYWKISAEELRSAYALGRRDFRYADLRRAILTDAILTDADLRRAILTGADLRRAILTGAILTGAMDFISDGPVGQHRRMIYAGFEDDGSVYVQAGCRHDTPEAVVAAIELDYPPGVMRDEYIAAVRSLATAAEAMRSGQSDTGGKG